MLKNECKHSHSQPFSPCIPNYCRVIHNTSLACGQEKKPLCSVTSQTTDVAQSIEGSVGLKLVFNWKDKSGLGEARCPWARLQWSCPVASGSGFNVWNRVSVNRAFLRKNRVLKRNLLNKTFKYDCRCLSQELFPILHTDCLQYVLYTNCYCIIFFKENQHTLPLVTNRKWYGHKSNCKFGMPLSFKTKQLLFQRFHIYIYILKILLLLFHHH